VSDGQCIKLGEHPIVVAQLELGRDQPFADIQSELVQGDGTFAYGCHLDSGEGVASPQRQGIRQAADASLKASRFERLPTVGDQVLEPVQVNGLRRCPQLIPERTPIQFRFSSVAARAKEHAKPMYQRVQGADRGRRWPVRPQGVDHLIPAYRLVEVNQQQGENHPLPGGTDPNATLVTPQLQRTQDPKLQVGHDNRLFPITDRNRYNARRTGVSNNPDSPLQARHFRVSKPLLLELRGLIHRRDVGAWLSLRYVLNATDGFHGSTAMSTTHGGTRRPSDIPCGCLRARPYLAQCR
jgi:hypothetical protein